MRMCGDQRGKVGGGGERVVDALAVVGGAVVKPAEEEFQGVAFAAALEGQVVEIIQKAQMRGGAVFFFVVGDGV